MSTPDFGKASENGDGEDDVVEVEADSLVAREHGIDVPETAKEDVEVKKLRRENEELREEVRELRETVEEMKQFVGMHIAEDLDIHCVTAFANNLEERVEDLEEDEETGEHVPGTKHGKIKKLLEENFDEWSIPLKGGDAVTTRVQEQKNRTRSGKSIHQHVMSAMDEEYGESIQHGQVHDVLEDLSDTRRYRLEETGSAKYLFKDS